MINASIQFKASGSFQLIVHSGDPDFPRIDTGQFRNIITNNGLNALLGGGASTSILWLRPVVGSGNATPSLTDTSLQSFIAGALTTATEFSTTRSYDAEPYKMEYTFRWRFAAGQVVGNVSEVGLANSGSPPNAASPLFCRSLVKDSLGNPTTITILPGESLDIIYKISVFPGSFASGTFDQLIDGVTVPTTYSIGPSNMASASTTVGWREGDSSGLSPLRPYASDTEDITTAYSTGVIGGAGSPPAGMPYRMTSATASSINLSDHYCDFTYSAGLDSANISIGSIAMSMALGSYKMSLSPPVVKTNEKTYSITVRVGVANAA